MEATLNVCNGFDLTGYIPNVVFVQFYPLGSKRGIEKTIRAKMRIQCIVECSPWCNCLGCTKAESAYFWGFSKNLSLTADPYIQPGYKKGMLHLSHTTSSPLAEVTGKKSMVKIKPEKSDVFPKGPGGFYLYLKSFEKC